MAPRVLVAEDEAMIALAIADVLEAEGYAVEIAGNGLVALRAARALGGALAVLVTDLNMPGLSGEELIRALRQDRPSLPVVVITGSAPPGGVAELCHGAGGDGWLTLLHKPFGIDELAQAVRCAAVGRQCTCGRSAHSGRSPPWPATFPSAG